MKLPQLTLRDRFWLVALVAMGCGWWVDHQQLVLQRDQAEGWRELRVGGTRHMQRAMRKEFSP